MLNMETPVVIGGRIVPKVLLPLIVMAIFTLASIG